MQLKERWQELLIGIALTSGVILIFVLISLFVNGCTTLHHNPECKCSCDNTKSYFECGGVIQHKELDIK